MIYFDYAANTPADPDVLQTFLDYEQQWIANPNSSHSLGKAAMAELYRLTEAISTLLQLQKQSILYTSGASEANNLALKGIAHQRKNLGKHIISTYFEHSSVTATLSQLQNEGYEIDYLPQNKKGQIQLDALQDLLRPDTILVSVSIVDSEVGILQPIHDIKQRIRSHSKALFHCDVTQAIGKVSFDFSKADLITFGAHKFNGLNGIGALIYDAGLDFEIQIHGGKSFSPYRSGSPTLALIASMEKALQLALKYQEDRFNYVCGIRNELAEFFLNYPQVLLHSQPNYPFLLNLSVLGIKSVEMKDALDEKGICLSVRSACSSENSPSRMVQQITGNRKAATSSLRISLSHLTTHAHIEALKQAFHACYSERIPHGKS